MILHRNRGGTIAEPTMIFSFNFDVQKFKNSKIHIQLISKVLVIKPHRSLCELHEKRIIQIYVHSVLMLKEFTATN